MMSLVFVVIWRSISEGILMQKDDIVLPSVKHVRKPMLTG